MSEWFNSDQDDYMRSLAKMKPEEKCDCGWYPRGECSGTCAGDVAKGGKLPALHKSYYEGLGGPKDKP